VYFQKDHVYARVAPDSDAWARHTDSSARYLPSWISLAILASKSLSVSQIDSFDAKGNVFLGGKVLLVGQACAEIEPYLGESCNLAARHAQALAEVFSCNESWEVLKQKLCKEWGPRTLPDTQNVAAASKHAGILFRGESD
jgi:2-polyprenyl-6-methoxyphenol hydroxylase-like FAD-dependent oxidoreductase